MIDENLIFDPFDTNLDSDTFDDIDPDKNYYNTHPSTPSKYVHTEAINKIFDSNHNLNYFSIFHMNIRSTKKIIYDVKTFLSTIDHKFTIIAFTETWLQPHNLDLYNLDGYNIESSIRTSKSVGGVSIYIKDDLQYKNRTDLNFTDNNLEMIWLEVDCSNLTNSKNKIIGCIYRKPGADIELFNEKLSSTFETIRRENKTIYHFGDFNIDLIKHSTHQPTNNF
jgi:exonuclease III